MESNKSDYQNVLHLLLDKLSANIDNISLKVPYPKILNSMNSKQLVGVMKELDSWITSPDRNLSRLLNASESMTDPPSPLHVAINGYTVSIIAVIGLILNTIGIYFLSSVPRRGQILSLMMSSLLAFNAIYLVFETLKSLELWMFTIPKRYFKSYLTTVNAGIRSSMISSIFMLVAISRVRLCAIRKPFQHSNAILSWKERRNYWLRYCIPIVISSLILTSPLVLEIEDTGLQTNDTNLVVTPTNLRLHPVYSVLYIGVLNLGILGLIPIACLVYLAYHIRMELVKNTQRRERLGRVPQLNQVEINRTESSEDSVTRGLVAVILTFIGFHTFRVLVSVGEMYVLLDPDKENSILQHGGGVPAWLEISLYLSELLMVTNATVNVVVYLKPYSNELVQTFWPTKRENNSSRGLLTKRTSENDSILMDDRPFDKNEKEDESHGINNFPKHKISESVGILFTKSKSQTYFRALTNELDFAPQQTIRRRSMCNTIEEA